MADSAQWGWIAGILTAVAGAITGMMKLWPERKKTETEGAVSFLGVATQQMQAQLARIAELERQRDADIAEARRELTEARKELAEAHARLDRAQTLLASSLTDRDRLAREVERLKALCANGGTLDVA